MLSKMYSTGHKYALYIFIEQLSPSKLSAYSGAFCALCFREQVVGGRECVLKDIGMRITNCRVDLDIETIDIFRRLLSAMF